MSFKKVNIDIIRQDGGTQARECMNSETIQEYAALMAEGVEFPPVVLFFDGQVYWLGDGFHRVAAARQTKQKAVQAEVHDGGFRDALLFAVGANALHGLRRTNADKRRAVSKLLDDPEWSQWSDNEIAKRVGVSQPFVSKMRQDRVITVITPESKKHIPKEKEGAGPTSQTEGLVPREAVVPAPAPQTTTDNRVPVDLKSKAAALDSGDVAALKAQVEELKAKVSDLQAKLCEAGCQVQELHEENESLHQILDAEDLLAAFKKEVLSAQERARVAESQRNGVMVENRDLAGRLKSALRKIENLQKKAPEAPEEVAS